MRLRIAGLSFAFAALCLLLAPTHALAQAVTAGAGAEDPYSVVDGNNINLVTGKPSLVSHDLSIGDGGQEGRQACWSDGGWTLGSEGEGCSASGSFRDLRSNLEEMNSSGLEVTRNWNQSSAWQSGNLIGGWTTNWASNLSLERGRFTVVFGNQTFIFNNVSGNYNSMRGDGATLTPMGLNAYQVTTRDGTVIQFPSVPSHYYTQPGTGPATQVTYPNGRVINITYAKRAGCGNVSCSDRTYLRIQQISSSDNYGLLFEYPSDDGTADNLNAWIQPSRITAFNRSVDACPVTQAHCTFSQTWPTVSYAASATLMTSTSAAGRTTSYELSGGKITRIRDPDGNIVQDIAYYPQTNVYLQNRVSSVTRGGQTWSYTPSQNISLPYAVVTMTVVDPLGGTTVTKGDSKSGILEVTDPLNRRTTYSYDAQTRLVTTVRPDTSATTVTYDARGNTTETRQVATTGSGLADITTSATFPATCTNARTCNRPTTSTNERGFVTDYTYDPVHGGILTETLPAVAGGIRPEMRYAYSQINGAYRLTSTSLCQTLASCTGTADEVRRIVGYDAANALPVSITTASGTGSPSATYAVTYDQVGNALTISDPMGNLEYSFYDADRRVVGMISTDPDGAGPRPRIALRYTYNAAGQPTHVARGNVTAATSAALAAMTADQTEQTAYDLLGRRASITALAGTTAQRVRQFSYDAIGRIRCTAVRMNPAAFASLPASACTLGTQGSGSNDFGPDRISLAVYDVAGQRVQLRDGVGSAEEAAEATWAYDVAGRVTTIIDANGNRTDYLYDGHGRQTRANFPSPSRPSGYDDSSQPLALLTAGSANAADYEEYGYDAGGNRTSLRKRDCSTLSFSYDSLNRMIVKVVPERPAGLNLPACTSDAQALTAGQTRDVYYAYDLRGLQTAARFDSLSGEGVSNIYDVFGRLVSSSTNMGGTTRTLSYLHDLNGNRTRIVHPDGQYFDTVYDGLNRPASLSDPLGWKVFYSYFPHGALYAVQRSNGVMGYRNYDGLQRLYSQELYHPSAYSGSDILWIFGRNPADQLVWTVRTNDAYAWTAHYAVQRSYTTNGLNQYSAAGNISFTYDRNGNLIRQTTGGGGTQTNYVYDIENRLVSSSNAALSYDPLGRLYQVSAGATVTRFLYDGDALVAEYDGTGAMAARYVHNVGSDVPMLAYQGSGLSVVSHLNADHLGSIISITDAAGSPTARNSYDEYGIPAATNAGRFQYTGQIWLPELGMYHYKARIYSPYIGRFLQTDPIGYGDQFNLYAYVGNDPVNAADPSGTCVEPQNATRGTPPTARCQDARRVWSSDAGALTVARNEGYRPTAYASAEGGSPTVGIGHKVRPSDNIRVGQTISHERIREFFVQDLYRANVAVKAFLGNTRVSQQEFDALVDLTFNAGAGVLSERTSPNLNRAARRSDYEAMSNELRYTRAGSQTLGGLIRRSDERRRLFRDGVYPGR